MDMIKHEKYRHTGMAFILALSLLTGCGTKEGEEVPLLLDPVEVSLTGKTVEYGDICDVDAYQGSIKADSVSYAFSQGTYVNDLTIHVGQYIEKGELIAEVNTASYEKERKDLQAEIAYLDTVNTIETALAEDGIESAKLDLVQIPSGSRAYDEAQKQLDIRITQKEYEKSQRELEIEEKKSELEFIMNQNGGVNMYASESGYLTYVKDLSTENTTGYVNAGEILAVTAREDSFYISAAMPLAEARQADRLYAQIGEEQYELTYVPYDDSRLKWASNTGVTLESRFTCKEDLSAMEGSMVTVFAVSNLRENVLSVSPDAVYTENAGSFVYLLKDGRKVQQEVETGIRTGNAVEILSGLSQGDVVCSVSGELPGSRYSLVTIEPTVFRISKRYDTAKMAYPLVTKVVNEADEARIIEINVQNGQEVKTGDVLAVLEAGNKSSAAMENRADLAALKRNYEYEMSIYRTELDELFKQKEQMEQAETTYTSSYKKLLLAIHTKDLNMQKETAAYEYETGRLKREQEQDSKENGTIPVTAKKDGVIRELTSVSVGGLLQKDELICKIADPDFVCIKLFAEDIRLPAATKVRILNGGDKEETDGIVVSSVSQAQADIYEDNRYVSETGSQSKNAVYILAEDEEIYDSLSSFGIKVDVWKVDNAIVTDSGCLYQEGEGSSKKYYVWVKEGETFSKRYVTVGYLDHEMAWILQGLQPGEQIMLENGQETEE